MNSLVHFYTPTKKWKQHQTINKKLLLSLFAFLLFAIGNAQTGSECYKPFTGSHKVPNAIQNNVVCVECGTNGNLTNLIDGDITNFVALNQLAGIASGNGVTVKDGLLDSPGGYYAGYVLGLDPTLLNVNVLSGFTISTYRDDILQQSFSGSSLTAAPLVGGGLQKTYLYFKTSSSFDEVRFTFNSLIASLSTLNVYYAMAFDPNCGNNESNSICDDALQGAGTVVNFSGGLVCALCNLSNSQNLVDANKDNYATLSLPAAVLATSSVGVLDEQNIYPAGNKAGFIIAPDDINALLDANVLNNITIETYLFGTLQESQVFSSGGGLLSVSALSSSAVRKTKIGFTTTKKFNEVRLKVNQPAGVSLGGIRIYGAYEEPVTCSDCENPLISIAANPYTGSLVTGTYSCGLLCNTPWTGVYGIGLHSLTNSANVVSASLTDYATYSSVVGLSGTGVNVSVQNNGSTFPAGTFGGFAIAKEGGLVDVNLLPAITISLYNGTTLVASQSGTALLGAGVLTLTEGKTVVGFKSTAAFNRIKINIDNGLISAALGGNYRIYYAFVIQDTDNDGTPDCIDNCLGANNMDTDGDGIPDACDACNTASNAPVLGATHFTASCPSVSVDLSTVTANNKPSGTTLTFHSGFPATPANKLSSITSVIEGTYYASFFDATNNCYSSTRQLVITISCSFTPLPVNLIAFTASLNNNNNKTVSVKWTTATERNVNHFVVEKSYNGINFQNAAVVMAYGNTTSKMNYSYTDNITTVQNELIYYRLRTLDIDGKSELSQVRSIRIDNNNTLQTGLLTYPNPVVSNLEITIPTNWQGKKLSYELINHNGQAAKRLYIGKSGHTEQINLTHLVPGYYILKLTCNGQSAQQKIVKK
ncbi:MAG TPA: T9SS type A sorting domain-containing protein [Chitinophagaceae bacterium]|nr:T9SS type A sorting domain-containing protein [Chitinophagaceae bacterium]